MISTYTANAQQRSKHFVYGNEDLMLTIIDYIAPKDQGDELYSVLPLVLTFRSVFWLTLEILRDGVPQNNKRLRLMSRWDDFIVSLPMVIWADSMGC
jgi:hypothetical protein